MGQVGALELVEDEEIVPGIRSVTLGCHTNGSQGVLVQTHMGPVLLTAGYNRANTPGTSDDVLTLVFEFGMGTLSGASWETMLADYDILHGRLWPLIPVSALIAPWFWGAVGAAGRP